jgi:hypothetical protein
MEKTKVSKIIARRKRINQDGDKNEEKRRKTNENAHGLYTFKKQCIVNLSKEKKGRK